MQLPSKNFINGIWVDSDSKLSVVNKYDQSELANVALANSEQAEIAIESSINAFNIFKSSSAEERSNLLTDLAEALKLKGTEFSKLISQEAGKPISYAKAEVERCITTLTIAAKEALNLKGDMIPMDYGIGKGKTSFTLPQPIGPIIAISPFNFPLNLALHKIAPAIAAGCSITIKPSPYTPLSLLAFGKIFEEVGGLKGLLNIVTCENSIAETLVTDERFKLLSFTGSPEIGWMLKSKAGKKKVILELGGNAGVYIDEKQNLNEIAKQCAIGAFLYSGQICISTQRIFVHENEFEAFIHLLKTETEKLQVGDPENELTIVGPLIDTIHLERINSWVSEAQSNGAQIISGGKIESSKHNLYQPTILTNVPKNLKISCEEAFGPVVIIEKVKDYQKGIEQINDSKFGLQAGVFVSDINKIKWINNNLDVGGIIYNNIPGFRMDSMPYGGIKDSGLGKEGIKYALKDMLEEKLIVL